PYQNENGRTAHQDSDAGLSRSGSPRLMVRRRRAPKGERQMSADRSNDKPETPQAGKPEEAECRAEPSAGPEARLRVVSERKRAANRRNAQHSTGPRTPEGKRVSRFNAMKHGLLANVVVVDEGFEDADAFRRLRERLRAECQPVDFLEEIQVEKAAVAYWRMRRALGHEAREIHDDLEREL